MGAKSDYLENKILDHVLGGGDYTRPATVYFALFTSAPTDAGGGTEVSGGAYARVAVTNNGTNFPSASGGAKSNGTDVVWPVPTAGWGTAVAVGIFDASTAGNLLFWCLLTTPRLISTTDDVRISAGQLDFTED